MQGNKVLTLSNSKTVYEVLKQWNHFNKKLEVVVLESQPKCEGKVLAGKLKKAGIKVNVVLDSEMSRYIEKSDLILLGCDLIFKDGSVLNKTGSRDAAIIAWYFNKPVLIVSSKTKHSNRKKINIEGRDRSESLLFETVEKELITHLVTD
jgi:translation initiation factor 2B subunit (eIF-2B alpha/beta/delta family)